MISRQGTSLGRGARRKNSTFLNVWPGGETTKQRERLAREALPIVRDLIV